MSNPSIFKSLCVGTAIVFSLGLPIHSSAEVVMGTLPGIDGERIFILPGGHHAPLTIILNGVTHVGSIDGPNAVIYTNGYRIWVDSNGSLQSSNTNTGPTSDAALARRRQREAMRQVEEGLASHYERANEVSTQLNWNNPPVASVINGKEYFKLGNRDYVLAVYARSRERGNLW